MPSVVNECTEGLARVCGFVLREWVLTVSEAVEKKTMVIVAYLKPNTRIFSCVK